MIEENDDDNTCRWIVREPVRQNRVESRRKKFASIERGCDIAATKRQKKTNFGASSFSITMTQHECLLTYLLMGHFLHSSLLFFFSIRFFLFFTRVYRGWWRLSLFLSVVVPTTTSYAYLGSEYRETRRKKYSNGGHNHRSDKERRKERKKKKHHFVHHLITWKNNDRVTNDLVVFKMTLSSEATSWDTIYRRADINI